MRKLLLLSTLLIQTLVYAQTEKMNPPSTKTKWLKNSHIEFSYSQPDSASFSPSYESGKNWFFEYVYKAPENPEMTDDEMTEIIGFEIPPVKGNSFKLVNKQLQKARTYYLLGCFCKDRGFKLVSKGNITGRKINATTWMITFNLTIDSDGGQIIKYYTGKYSLKKN